MNEDVSIHIAKGIIWNLNEKYLFLITLNEKRKNE